MTPEEIDRLDELNRKATAGLLHVHPGDPGAVCGPSHILVAQCRNTERGGDDHARNARAIAANHNAMPALLSAARREKVLEAQLEAACRTLDKFGIHDWANIHRTALAGPKP